MLVSRREPRLDSRHPAFLYQVQAVEAVRTLEYAALFHEQGLGKTKIGLDLALTWLKDGAVDSVVIVTKRSLLKNWADEIKAHTFFEARLLVQDRQVNFFAFNSPARLYLTHYEVLKSERRRLLLFQRTRRIGIILDEAHKIKNPDAEITKAVLSLASGFVRRVIMTGTPVANRPYDIWAPIFFLDGGKSLGASFSDFSQGIDLNSEVAEDEGARATLEKGLSTIFARIRAFSVRSTKGTAGIQLPEKHVENISVSLEPAQRKLYDQFQLELSAEVVREGRIVEDNAEDILKRLVRLVQVASNPILVDESYSAEPGKLAVAQRLICKAISQGSKIIVWTNFIENAEWLGREFREFGSAIVHGNRSIVERNDAIEAFKKEAECRVLVATPGAAKEGLTLTVANHAVFFDRSFSLDDYLQAQDRIHRISQSRTCYIWNLVALETVDIWVDKLLAAKHLAAQLVQGDIDLSTYQRRANYDFFSIVREILGLGRSDDSASS